MFPTLGWKSEGDMLWASSSLHQEGRTLAPLASLPLFRSSHPLIRGTRVEMELGNLPFMPFERAEADVCKSFLLSSFNPSCCT